MRRIRPIFAAIAAGLAVAFLLAPAEGQAEGLFDFLFGPDPTPARPSAPPPRAPRDSAPSRRASAHKGAVGELRFAKPGEGGPGQGEPSTGGYCVRICDGYYFPLIKSTRATRQQSCEFACPSAPMEIYDGGSIETARNYKGERYTALKTAFAFRDKASVNCSCNDPKSSAAFFERTALTDPTLHSGDIVVEANGAFVYSGTTLVPLNRASFVPSQVRQRLRMVLNRAPARNPSLSEILTPQEQAVELSKADRTGTTTR
ncbi:DUF2865 domain-containing protein [Methylocystis sp. WRRC1]|uniref:DUF2865 domain-containing protein n=1 Tax=Methylocystis sp. WRRC1 TaxID=1732014 RepID=UPI001D1451B3|nr:DUF2865 domain-containing protein [Methylocystis sp. WRRC1]MCC3243965.1 DUF2865 domain-containing protein [Methylocystis sp. WRRC1]